MNMVREVGKMETIQFAFRSNTLPIITRFSVVVGVKTGQDAVG